MLQFIWPLFPSFQIADLVSNYGIVCIPHRVRTSNDDNCQLMKQALDRLQQILSQVRGTVILVNDKRGNELSQCTSTRCR